METIFNEAIREIPGTGVHIATEETVWLLMYPILVASYAIYETSRGPTSPILHFDLINLLVNMSNHQDISLALSLQKLMVIAQEFRQPHFDLLLDFLNKVKEKQNLNLDHEVEAILLYYNLTMFDYNVLSEHVPHILEFDAINQSGHFYNSYFKDMWLGSNSIFLYNVYHIILSTNLECIELITEYSNLAEAP